jgi:hypothetical protein
VGPVRSTHATPLHASAVSPRPLGGEGVPFIFGDVGVSSASDAAPVAAPASPRPCARLGSTCRHAATYRRITPSSSGGLTCLKQ